MTNNQSTLKFISWNVNGLRANMNKGFMNFFLDEAADIVALQEIKMKQEQATFSFDGYYEYWHSAEKLGYSGTCIITKIKPMAVFFDMPGQHPKEGRIITLEFEKYYFINIYVPNSQRDLLRLEYRMMFENDFKEYVNDLMTKKPVIICGDLNVAHQEIDIKNAKANIRNAGFTIEERTKMTELLSIGLIDTYRFLYPEKIEYTWWSYLFNARANNAGWRIDYFLMSKTIKEHLIDSFIKTEVYGSDHCPVGIIIKQF